MAESGSCSLGFRLDIKQILLEAQHRWLRPAEIVEILRNYQKFHISPEAPNKPVSGSVFLFDRKVLRYFRKDGHNWRKKKDGKTVKEAHEKLKVGSVDMLHCYYAHGEDNENFQRRSYWLLEQDLMHIVFVHYLEVKGNKTNISSFRNSDTVVSNSENNSALSSSFHGTSPSSTLSSAYEDAESEDNHQASSRSHSFPESPLTVESHYVRPSSYNPIPSPGQIAFKQESGCYLPVQANWQHSFEDFSSKLHIPTMNQKPILNFPPDHGNDLFEEKSLCVNQENFVEPFYTLPDVQKEQSDQRNLQMLLEAETAHAMKPNMENCTASIGNENYSLFMKKPSISGLQTDDSLKKAGSFSRWINGIAKELGETDELNLLSNNGISWNEYDSSMPAQLQVDLDILNPSISQDQLFSIIDISPYWAYTNMETKVLITGIFLKSEQELSKYRWSIMFGQVEVPAEVLADGILCCRAPPQKPGLVHFYVTCSNRLACSEIREFEYRFGQVQSMDDIDVHGSTNLMHLYQRFEAILSLETSGSHLSSSGNDFEKQNMINKIFSFMEDENNQEIKLSPEKDSTAPKVIGEQPLQEQLKDKFYYWLLQRVSDDSRGLTVVDEGGQGVLHLAAALGFNWALQPIIVSGISIDFRDVNGWTALHWAAHYGREDTVAALVSLGAAPGALTDPSAEYPLGRTPADLASSSGHKGISGFLAETTLTTHLSTLGVDDPSKDGTSGFSGTRAIQTVSERSAVPTTGEDVSLKDSLAAIRNATQAEARIRQIFRVQSFQRKQLLEHDRDELSCSDEHAISLLTANSSSRLGRSNGTANAAAVRIQKKFRGWKKRKEFLLIRQKIVKIQAHFRGHQVRKKYKTIIWSVGILEKVILRWRRKGSGLRGFRSDAVPKGENVQEGTLPQEDDYDFLKEGRKQTEERMEKALDRVRSMVKYPEGRAQYRRLLTAAEGFRETKDASDVEIQDNSEDMIYPQDDLIDIESLWDDDTFMSLAFQ